MVRVGGAPDRDLSVRRSGEARSAGGLANSGILYVEGNLNLGDGRAEHVARSVYLEQVRQIFPWQLVGRDAELAELEAFCSGQDGACYVWWQGPAWTGKSALMAWFALHPPDRIRVAPFFITDRYANHSNRAAFLAVMLEQLAQIAGQPMPDGLVEETRPGWFNQLLADATATCGQNGQRLVLLVDGLDEDQGVTGRSDEHSIAALLPAVPPGSTRVIVAGRPDPAVPADVPHWHPLRDERIIRPLAISPLARMVRDDAERELGHLLDDSGPGHRMLGLVTAAGGGLSAEDLSELTGELPRTVGQVLRAVSGRSFHGQPIPGQMARPPVFILAHGTLQAEAAQAFGPQHLAACRDQISGWADSYAARGWPG